MGPAGECYTFFICIHCLQSACVFGITMFLTDQGMGPAGKLCSHITHHTESCSRSHITHITHHTAPSEPPPPKASVLHSCSHRLQSLVSVPVFGCTCAHVGTAAHTGFSLWSVCLYLGAHVHMWVQLLTLASFFGQCACIWVHMCTCGYSCSHRLQSLVSVPVWKIWVHMCRVGQNHKYTVYKRYFWQGNHQIYVHLRCIYTVLANPTHVGNVEYAYLEITCTTRPLTLPSEDVRLTHCTSGPGALVP